MRLVEDNPASLSLLDVFKISCSKRQIEFDAAVGRYYEKIANTQLSGAIVSYFYLKENVKGLRNNFFCTTFKG